MEKLTQLKKLRKAKGLSQIALATKLGVDQPTISKYETGRRKAWHLTIEQFAKVLKCQPKDLL